MNSHYFKFCIYMNGIQLIYIFEAILVWCGTWKLTCLAAYIQHHVLLSAEHFYKWLVDTLGDDFRLGSVLQKVIWRGLVAGMCLGHHSWCCPVASHEAWNDFIHQYTYKVMQAQTWIYTPENKTCSCLFILYHACMWHVLFCWVVQRIKTMS